MVELHSISRLMQQEVTRQEFLQCVGVALLSFVGITHLVQSLQHGINRPTSQSARPQTGYGYGTSAYGK